MRLWTVRAKKKRGRGVYLVLSVGKVPVFVYSILGHFILAGVTKPACDVSHVSVCAPHSI